MRSCKSCGREIPAGAPKCWHCGANNWPLAVRLVAGLVIAAIFTLVLTCTVAVLSA